MVGGRVEEVKSKKSDCRSGTSLRAHDTFGAIGLGTGVRNVIALPVQAEDEHRASVAIASRLVGGQHGRDAALRRAVADALTETAMAELIRAAEEFNGIVGRVGSQSRLHGAVMLVAKGKDIRPHRQRV